MNKVENILKRYEMARAQRSGLISVWNESSDYVRPIKDDIAVDAGEYLSAKTNRLAALFDGTAIEGNNTYAAGCMSWMTPSESAWFQYGPPEHLSEDEQAQRWYSIVTDITQKFLANSNFYEQIHEAYLEDGAFGTSALHIDEHASKGIHFETLQIGDYCILENSSREVDTVFREYKFSARQAVQKFGSDRVSEQIRKRAEDPGKEDKGTIYLHVVMPREDSERSLGRIDGINQPWASIWIDKEGKAIVKEGGTWEMPVPVHRHIRWGSKPWGFAPAWFIQADMRQLNDQQAYLDTLVELQVNPRMRAPTNFEGRIDMRSGGVTYFKDGSQAPEEWATSGRADMGEARIISRQERVRNAFHVDLFQALAQVPVGKQMTASEVIARQRDRLTLFSPTFARKNSELNIPTMKRTFAILLRAGAYPEIPENIVQYTPDGLPFVPNPEINFTSRLALQIKAIHNESFLRALEGLAPLAEMNPSILDHLNMDKIARGYARNEGMKEEWLTEEADVEEIRRTRAEAQAMEQERIEAMEEADSVSKLASSGIVAAA